MRAVNGHEFEMRLTTRSFFDFWQSANLSLAYAFAVNEMRKILNGCKSFQIEPQIKKIEASYSEFINTCSML